MNATEPGQNPVEPDEQNPQTPGEPEPLTGDPVEQETQLDA